MSNHLHRFPLFIGSKGNRKGRVDGAQLALRLDNNRIFQSVEAYFRVGSLSLLSFWLDPPRERPIQRPIMYLTDDTDASNIDDIPFCFAGFMVGGANLKAVLGHPEGEYTRRPAINHTHSLTIGQRLRLNIRLTDGGQDFNFSVNGRRYHQLRSLHRNPFNIRAIVFGRPDERDFPKRNGRRDPTLPGSWQPPYDWIIERVKVTYTDGHIQHYPPIASATPPETDQPEESDEGPVTDPPGYEEPTNETPTAEGLCYTPRESSLIRDRMDDLEANLGALKRALKLN